MTDSSSSANHNVHRPTPDFLSGGGEMGELMRAHDWANTPFGRPETWPQSLRSAVSICLGTSFPIAIYWGPELALLYNEAWSSIPGEKHPWALGRPGREVWPEIWDTIGPLYEAVQRNGEGVWQQDQLLPMHRHGYTEECYFNFTFSPIRGEQGGVEGIFNAVVETTFRVISERRERVLRELAERIAGARSEAEVFETAARKLAESSPDFSFALLYRLAKDRKATLVGVSGIDEGGLAAPSVIDMADASAPWPLSEVVESGAPKVVDGLAERFGSLPGGVWPEPTDSALVVPITSATQADGTAGILVAGLNPRRALDEEYRTFILRAAAHIGTSLATARAYEDERKRAEALAALDQAKTLFFSNVSHEFRTPLTLMLGPLEDLLARAESLPPSEREQIAVAHRNGMRLLKLVNSLLDFSRIEAGRTQAAFEPTDLAAFTAELASNFQSATEKAGLTLTVDCPPLPQPVFVDRDMWEKIVLNLLSNAFKFTFEGGIVVELREVNSSAELMIRDSGVGIPERELPRVFERFHRIEGSRGRSFEGSGIGLALVQELVRLHGGTIRVESEEGKGTAFTVAIPFGACHLRPDRVLGGRALVSTPVRAHTYVEEALRWLPDAGSALAETLDSEIPIDLPSSRLAKRARILLADDNADMRDYVKRLLMAAGSEVEAVADGETALVAARRARPDLVLSDVMMPRLDGFGLLRALRGDPDLGTIPVILLSARAGEEAEVEGLQAGADDYLVKPFSARELLARVAANIELSDIRSERTRLLEEESRLLEILNRVGSTVAAELDLDRVVQFVTDAATELTGAAFGSFFYNVTDDQGGSYMLYTLSGVPRDAFSKFPMPRNTAVFGPTFNGEGIVRSDDILQDPRYGKNDPHFGMPKGHLPVRSYLAAPVISGSGKVLGGLFFGHPEPDKFSERSEKLVKGIAAQAAIAIDNARLFRAAEREISERRRAESALKTLNMTLEQKVADEVRERTRVEEHLRHAQKMEAIGHLTGGIAHDFNNLLTIVVGNIESLQRHMPAETPDRMRRSAQNAMQGAKRAAILTQRLLAFSRRQPLEPKSIQVNKLVSNVSAMLGRTLGEAIELQTVLAGGLWRVEIDPNQLESALVNLAVNARDAMPGGGKLTIETANAHLDETYSAKEAEVLPGQYVVLAVSDTGTGMPKEVLGRVFEPFFTTKPTGHGTGLGLSQVYGFVKQSGGHVKIYSELDQGTTVKIYLPRFLGADAEDDERAVVVPNGDHHETILVVEDDDDVRQHSSDILRELGYRVIEAPDGPAALRQLEHHAGIHLLFTDVGLPGMNGRELADEARRRQPDLKVLFTTGYARNAIVHHGRLDPGVQMISKPFTYADLAAKVRSVIDDPD